MNYFWHCGMWYTVVCVYGNVCVCVRAKKRLSRKMRIVEELTAWLSSLFVGMYNGMECDCHVGNLSK